MTWPSAFAAVGVIWAFAWMAVRLVEAVLYEEEDDDAA